MNCKEAKALISEFYDRELNQEISQALGKHLEGCLECQKEYDSFQKIMKVLNKLKTYDLPRDYLKGIKKAKNSNVSLFHKKLSKFIKKND